MSEKGPGVNPLEQFVLLAKSAKGAAAVALIKQALEAQGVYVFGELLDMPNIKELANSDNHSPYWLLLILFAYGTFPDYLENKETLPTLTPIQEAKLRHLTIVSLASESKCIPYSQLLSQLNMKNLRVLEDLIIEVIYADVIRGKLDQKNHMLEVDYTIGRDVRPEEIPALVSTLQNWVDGCETVLSNIEQQIIKANEHKAAKIKLKAQVETEVTNIKKTLKSQQAEADETMISSDMQIPQQEKPSKKASKSKGLRGSGKIAQMFK